MYLELETCQGSWIIYKEIASNKNEQTLKGSSKYEAYGIVIFKNDQNIGE